MTYDPDGAIEILKDGLSPKHPGHFVQADALVCPYSYLQVDSFRGLFFSLARFRASMDLFVSEALPRSC